MAGRARKPASVHVLHGTMDPEQRRRAENAPPARFERLTTAPKHLDAEEREAWDLFAENAGAMRITTKEDREALEMLAVSWAHAQRLRSFFRKRAKDDEENVFTYETVTPSGGTMIRPLPEVGILNELDRKVLVLMGRFGLTPADRTRVADLGKKGGKSDADKDDEFS